MTKIGFTGTRNGMTAPQKQAFLNHLTEFSADTLSVEEFHHGDCVGADEQADQIIRQWRSSVSMHIHPPLRSTLRAFCPKRDHDTVYASKEYLERNNDIVEACTYLIACPASMTFMPRSGTWNTIIVARYSRRRTIVIRPNGELYVSW